MAASVNVRITCLRGSPMSSHGLPAAASWNGMILLAKNEFAGHHKADERDHKVKH